MIYLLNSYNGGPDNTHINEDLYNKLHQIFDEDTSLSETINLIESLTTTAPEEAGTNNSIKIYIQNGISYYPGSGNQQVVNRGSILTLTHNSSGAVIAFTAEKQAKILYILDKLTNSFKIKFGKDGTRTTGNAFYSITFRGHASLDGYYCYNYTASGARDIGYYFNSSSSTFRPMDSVTPSSSSATLHTLTYGSEFSYIVEVDSTGIAADIANSVSKFFVSR